jgi:hypothetical protein
MPSAEPRSLGANKKSENPYETIEMDEIKRRKK